MKKLKSLFPEFFGGIASGLLIAIGGTVLLSVENRVVGAIMFSVALLSICMLDLFLYTGKIGFLAEVFEKKMKACGRAFGQLHRRVVWRLRGEVCAPDAH